jgi:uncharacterized protein
VTAAILAAGGVAHGLARSAVAVADMVWMTLWALVFGFLLSGAVQRFASTASLQRRLGDHSWRSVARATSYGAASSSCSYAAVATARSLLASGADAVSAFVFMVASTNLVIELGAVILGLLGWRFLGAQLAGGIVLVVLLAVVGGRFLRGRVVDDARARTAATVDGHGGHDCHAPERDRVVAPSLHSIEGWSDAAALGLADATMVRRELVAGFVLAGVLSVVVPAHGWTLLFLHGHGVWTTIENALLAPVIAALSCVCSVGNVPLAATLWRGGIGFTGTLAFLFADVLALPLVFVYRRYFGAAVTLRLVAVLYAVIVASALVVGGAFSAIGLAPSHVTSSAADLGAGGLPTTVLNVVALGTVGALLLARARRGRARDRAHVAVASSTAGTAGTAG